MEIDMAAILPVFLAEAEENLAQVEDALLALEASPGDVAMERLLDEVLQAGARRSGLAARVYGGACVLAAFRTGGDHLGDRNVEAALRFLEDERIPVLERDTGGRHGRRLLFHTRGGAAEARRI